MASVHLANVPKQPDLDSEPQFNSDLAFTVDYAIGSNYDGFVVYDISHPEDP